jgi:hypothetical protein
MRWTSKQIRDAITFLVGAGGFTHEVIWTRAERPTLLFVCLALMGVPFFLRKDEADAPSPQSPRPDLEPASDNTRDAR